MAGSRDQDITQRRLADSASSAPDPRFRKVFEEGGIGMVIVDRQFHFARCNAAFCAFVGYSEEELGRLTFRDITHPDHLVGDVDNVNKVLAGEIPSYRTEKRYVRKDGQTVWGAANITAVRDDEGQLLYFLTVVADITERKQAEESLRKSDERHRIILRTAMDGFWMVGLDGRLVQVNDAYCRMSGYSEHELLNMTVSDLEVAESPAETEAHMRSLLTGGADRFETKHRCKDGSTFDVEISVQYQPTQGGWIVAFLRDISERKRTEVALAIWEKQVNEALQRLDLAVQSGRLGVWDWNVVTDEMVWDDEMLRMYGYTRESFPGGVEAWERGLHPEDRERARADSRAALEGIRPFDTEFRVARPDGEVRWIKADGLVLRDGTGRPIRMLGLNRDVTAARKNEAAVRENEAIFSTFLEHSPVHVFFKDNHARVLRLSRSYETLLGIPVEQALGKGMDELFPPELAKSMIEDDLRILREGRRGHVVEQLGDRFYETTKFPIFVEGEAVMLAGFTVDITERKKAEAERARLQEQLAQSQKMESVGRLAGGVAHDFNNMLGVMLGHLELAEEQLDPSSPVVASLREIHKAARRSADLTRQLLAFARKQTIAPKVLDLNETVDGMLTMLRRLVGENIDLVWSPGQGIGAVRMDPTQIHQILANLCVNARDAIKDVGRIRISSSAMDVDEDYCNDHLDALPGEHVVLTIADDGCGMDRATMTRLFEPFFTTKELGRGTGLGLSTVHGIVKQNGGHINVHSEPGGGSVFEICLPAHSSSSSASADAPDASTELGGRETILLVEDEEALLQMSRRMLERLGYTVLPAHGPGEALRLAKDLGGAIHLLITDVVMPEMNGRDLASAVRDLVPGLRCIYMSGYTADFIASQGVLDKGITYLQKPFCRSELAATVRRVLDSSG
jgi:two-component system, cell cycle sensor histidine kinase and response regulator CckA